MTSFLDNLSALIVVDVQNDFCPGGALEVKDGDTIIPFINGILDNYNFVVFTKDWHPEDHISFAKNHGKEAFSTIALPYGEQVLWPVHCVAGTHGSEFHSDLKTDVSDWKSRIFYKGSNKNVDSYSAFLEADRVTETGLRHYLSSLGVKKVDVVGLATDFCVAWTALDSAQYGFKTRVLMEGCRAIDNAGSLDKAILDMKSAGVEIMQDSKSKPVIWSKEQVDRLNDFQKSGMFHPFTCPGDKPECQNHRELIATETGWVCACGEYHQNWAHDFMMGELPKNPFADFDLPSNSMDGFLPPLKFK